MPATRDGKTWRSQFYYEDWQGVRHKKNKRGFKTKAEAEEWERNFRQQQRKDLDINFENFVEIYFADVENRLRESTIKNKRYVFDLKVTPYFKKKKMCEIKTSDIRAWQNELIKQGYAPTYLKSINNQLAALFNYAVRYYDLNDKNSIYKTYLACDAVSEEILLSHHYRCNKKIISFNNKKYYNNKLIINSPDKEANPLIFKNIPANTTNYKNTAPQEVEEIISFIKENPDKSIGIITPFTNQKELIQHALKENGMENIPCGTVHAFQGDEKDVVLFSLAITQQTYQGTYDWLKNNKELINVATSRAKDQLVILSDIKELKRLHSAGDDDIYELVDYVQTNGEAQVTARETSSRALGIKPYSTQTEAAFLTTLNHALDNVLNTNNRCVVQREVSIAHVFQENESYDDLFYTGRFDFVVYEKGYRGQDMPILAIELDGKEHKENAIVRARDEKKNAICRAHGFELIRVENSYARRYNYIKNILIQYFKSVR